MARRPPAPRRPAAEQTRTRRSRGAARPGGAHVRPAGTTDRPAPDARPATSPDPTATPSTPPSTVQSPSPSPAPTAGPASSSPSARGGRLVPADRFRDLVRGRPWRRRRRIIIAAVAGTIALLLAALACLLLLPALQVRTITVTGTDYVPEASVRAAVSSATGSSVALLPTEDLERSAAAVPGVRSARVLRDWPDGMRVEVTERVPLARVTDAAGTVIVVDADGVELPAAAGEGTGLAELAVAEGSAHPQAATDAMLEVLAALPADLRGQVVRITASTASDVTLQIAPAEGAEKTVVWGEAKDSALKAEVVAALLSQPGSTIDVTSPVAPVTR